MSQEGLRTGGFGVTSSATSEVASERLSAANGATLCGWKIFRGTSSTRDPGVGVHLSASDEEEPTACRAGYLEAPRAPTSREC